MASRKLWRLWLLGVAAVWLAAFAIDAATPPAPPLVRTADRWLPVSPPRRPNGAELLNGVAGSPLWGVQPQVREAPPRWRFAAILRRGDHVVVAVRVDSPAPSELLLKAGDELPGGHRIAAIEADAVAVLDDRNERRWLSIRDPSPTATLEATTAPPPGSGNMASSPNTSPK